MLLKMIEIAVVVKQPVSLFNAERGDKAIDRAPDRYTQST